MIMILKRYAWTKLICFSWNAVVEINESELLGGTDDNKLSWKYHISSVCMKVACGVGVIMDAKKYTALTFWRTCITHPYILAWYIVIKFGISASTNITPIRFPEKGC